MNKYCTYCGHILPISPIFNDASSDDPYTDNDKLSSANENIMNDIMNDINSIDDLDSTSRSKDYSQKSRASSSFEFSDNENKNNNDIDYSNDPFMNKYNDDLSGTDSNDEYNVDHVNTVKHTSSNEYTHIKDDADKFLGSRIHSFKCWWHGLSKKSRIIIVIVVSAIMFMIVVNVANSGSDSSSSQQTSSQSESTDRDSITEVAHRLNKRKDIITIDNVTPRSNYIEVDVDHNSSQSDVEDVWDYMYEEDSNTSIPIRFIDDSTTFELGTGYSNSGTITWD